MTVEGWWEAISKRISRVRRRTVMLHEEVEESGSRALWARIDRAGDLHIEGQDLGPETSVISGDGEYEWFTTIAAADVPRFVELLGGKPNERVLEILMRDWRGPHAYEVERRLRESDIPFEFFSC